MPAAHTHTCKCHSPVLSPSSFSSPPPFLLLSFLPSFFFSSSFFSFLLFPFLLPHFSSSPVPGRHVSLPPGRMKHAEMRQEGWEREREDIWVFLFLMTWCFLFCFILCCFSFHFSWAYFYHFHDESIFRDRRDIYIHILFLETFSGAQCRVKWSLFPPSMPQTLPSPSHWSCLPQSTQKCPRSTCLNCPTQRDQEGGVWGEERFKKRERAFLFYIKESRRAYKERREHIKRRAYIFFFYYFCLFIYASSAAWACHSFLKACLRWEIEKDALLLFCLRKIWCYE